MKHLGEAETEEERVAEAVISANPEWAGSDVRYTLLCPDVVSPVHRGVESAVWRVQTNNGAPTVLKIMREDMRAHFDLEASVEGARRAGEAEAGPPVLWADSSSGAVAMPLLGEGWRTATLWEFQDQSIMAQVLDTVKRLHSAAPLKHRFDIFTETQTLCARARAAGVDLPPDFWWLETALDDIAAAVAASGTDIAPCRNDGVSSNVMVGPDCAVMLLDYDRAGMNDPLYDLAALIVEAYPFETEMLPVIEQWCGRADPEILNRCIAYGVADDLMWALWGAIAAQESPRTHVEFRKYSEWRFLRCRSSLGDPRFEERLRRL